MARAWPYRIATNVCLDMIRRSSRRVAAMHSFAEVPWLQPYPGRLLDEIGPTGEEPEAVAVNGHGQPCRSICRRGDPIGLPPRSAPKSESCLHDSSMPMNAVTGRP